MVRITPIYKQKHGHLEGEKTPILRGRRRSPWLSTTLLQVALCQLGNFESPMARLLNDSDGVQQNVSHCGETQVGCLVPTSLTIHRWTPPPKNQGKSHLATKISMIVFKMRFFLRCKFLSIFFCYSSAVATLHLTG